MQITSNPLLLEFVLTIISISVVLSVYLFTSTAERKDLLQAWKTLQPFERNCLKAGFLVFVFVNLPFLATEVYTSQVLLSITTVLGGALFAFGALAFLKSLHDVVNRNDDSGWR